jgi:hypothetical protein
MGGDFRKRRDVAGRLWLDEVHRFDNVDLRLNPSKLERMDADHIEFHCLLARAEVFDKTGPFDEQVMAASEHIDFAHALRRHKFRIVVEPRAVVSYLADAEFNLSDVPFFQQRWSDEWMTASIQRFREKRDWPNREDSPLYEAYWAFVASHRRLCDVQRAGMAPQGLISTDAHPFGQTILQLTQQLSRSGMPPEELERLTRAYQTAQFLFDGIYRENGRTLLEHLVGTTSVLAAYGAPLNMLCAGLLHAAYGLGRFPADVEGNLAAARRWLEGRIGGIAERQVYAYHSLEFDALSEELLQGDADRILVRSAYTVLLRIANSIDEHLDGGLLFTADAAGEIERNRRQNETWHVLYRRAASLLGCTAMHDLLLVLNTEIAGRALSFKPAVPLLAGNLRFTGDEVAPAARSWPAVAEAVPTEWLDPKTWLPEQLQPRLGSVLKVYGLEDIEPANGGSIELTPGFPLSLFARPTMQIKTPAQAWTYAACLRLDPAAELFGEAFVRCYVQVQQGELEVLLADREFGRLDSVNQAIRSEDDKVELWFHVPDLQDAAALVFRSRRDDVCKVRVLDVSLHAVETAAVMQAGAAAATELVPLPEHLSLRSGDVVAS